jgi:hypothetical protein
MLEFDLAGSGEAWDGIQRLCWNGGGYNVGSIGVAQSGMHDFCGKQSVPSS